MHMNYLASSIKYLKTEKKKIEKKDKKNPANV